MLFRSGSYRGGSALVLRRLAQEKHLHLFDTWSGNPYQDPLCHHGKGEWAATLEGCREVVGNGELTWYHVGIFPTNIDGLVGTSSNSNRIPHFSFVYIDMDTYQATKDALEFFWQYIVPGGVMMIDDYNWEPCAGVRKAIDEIFPDDECRRYGHMQTGLSGCANKRVIQSLCACVLKKVP